MLSLHKVEIAVSRSNLWRTRQRGKRWWTLSMLTPTCSQMKTRHLLHPSSKKCPSSSRCFWRSLVRRVWHARRHNCLARFSRASSTFLSSMRWRNSKTKSINARTCTRSATVRLNGVCRRLSRTWQSQVLCWTVHRYTIRWLWVRVRLMNFKPRISTRTNRKF